MDNLLDINLDATDFCYNSILSNVFPAKIKTVYVKQNILSCTAKLLSTDKENILARRAIDTHAQGFVEGGMNCYCPSCKHSHRTLSHYTLLGTLDISNLSSITVSRSHP